MRFILLAVALCAIPAGFGFTMLALEAPPGSSAQVALAAATLACAPIAIGCILIWSVLYERAYRLRMGLPGRRYRQIVRTSGAEIPRHRRRFGR